MTRLRTTLLRGMGFSVLSFSLLISQAKATVLWSEEWKQTPFDGLKAQALRILGAQNENVFTPQKAVQDAVSATIKFKQTYKGVEVFGKPALFHYSPDGKLQSYQSNTIAYDINTTAQFPASTALQILDDRYQSKTKLSEPAALNVWTDFQGKGRLVYVLKTSTTAKQDGQRVLLDAHTGEVLLETPRNCLALHATVYRADTKAAQRYVNRHGYPTRIDSSLYVQSVNGNTIGDTTDRSALNALQHAQRIYDYYYATFGRRSYDDKDSPIQSIVHAGFAMNNAFWNDEAKIIAYGDGDGENYTDFSYALDLAAHEITHAVTSSEADLVYAAESGALNESYSDFFSKMIDYHENDWNWGTRFAAKASGHKAVRNLEFPERYGQPGSNNSPWKVNVNQVCNGDNDNCGVHTNSGIPSRASVLIVQALGKEKTQRLYYNVLTQRLTATSNFHDARLATEAACQEMFGAKTKDCAAVTQAFDTVGM